MALVAAGCLLARLLCPRGGILDLAWALPLGASVVLLRGAWRARPQCASDPPLAIGLWSVVLAQGIVWLACAAMTARAVVLPAGTESMAEQDLRLVVGGLGVLPNVGALIAVAGLPAGVLRKGWLVAGEIAWLVAGPLFHLLGPYART